jgi:hypothetical protein
LLELRAEKKHTELATRGTRYSASEVLEIIE